MKSRYTYMRFQVFKLAICLLILSNVFFLNAQVNSFTVNPKINFGHFFPTQTKVLEGADFMTAYNMSPFGFSQVILQSGRIKTVVLHNGGFGLDLFYHRKRSADEYNWSVGGSFFVQKHLYQLDVPDFDFKGSRSSAIIDYYRYFAYKLCIRKSWINNNDRDLFVQLNAVYSNNFKVNDNTWQNPEAFVNTDYTDNGYGYTVTNYDVLKDNFLVEAEFGGVFTNIPINWSVSISVPLNQYMFKSYITYFENHVPIGVTQTRESQFGIWANFSYPIELGHWYKKPKKPKPDPKPDPIIEPVVVNERKSTVQHTYSTKNADIIIEIFDNASADGDTASLYFNGEWILEKYPVNKEPKQLNIHLEQGQNDLLLYAISLGITPPNTAAIRIIDGEKVKTMVLNSDYNRCGSIRIYKE
jgi:hypothetical protein